MNSTICLIGNPNCGKTTLFNALTGTYQKVGNWAGVTTEKKEGKYKKNKNISIVDLPGLYSINATSSDEKAVLEYLESTPPDLIINVLDGTNLERNLYLTCQLCALNIPIVLAVNFSDELGKNNVILNVNELSKLFSSPVIEISALKNKNINELMKIALSSSKKPTKIDENISDFLQNNISKIIQERPLKSHQITEKIDSVLLNKFLSIPIFLLVVTIIYFLSIKIGGFFGGNIGKVFDNFCSNTQSSLILINAPEWLISLVCSAVLKGFSNILSFLPQILILFLLLTLLEESGYASRVSFILDSICNKFGLSGKSFIPFIVSSGCIVPGIMATRTIEGESEKKITIFTTPFMPCGAKMAVFGWFSHVFFNGNPFIATSLYMLSVIVALASSLLLKKLKYFSNSTKTFFLEIPPYRIPSVQNIIYVLWEKTKDFLVKAGTVIFGVSVLLWLLKNFGIKGYTFGIIENSFLYYIGNVLKYVFYPLGFCNWQTSIAVLSGILAKEAIVESLLFVASAPISLFSSRFAVYAFMTFVLLSPPCIASISTAKRELKSVKATFMMLIFQTITAYLVSFFINLLGKIVYGDLYLIFYIILGIIITGFIVSVKSIFKPCSNCKTCKESCKKKYERAK